MSGLKFEMNAVLNFEHTMTKLEPETLGEWTDGVWNGGVPLSVTGCSIDTRTLQPGDLFFALKSDIRDGHDFLSHAAERGAAAAVVSRADSQVRIPQLQVDYPLRALQIIAARWRQRFSGSLVGVTGSVGKTSTKEMLALLLGDRAVHRTFANFNNLIGVPLTLLRIPAADSGFSVVEIGANRPGEIGFLADLADPTHSIVTAVTEVHIEGFGSLEGVAEEKAWLPRLTRPGGLIVMPGDCLRFEAMREGAADIVSLVTGGIKARPLPESGRVVSWSREVCSGASTGCRLQLCEQGAPPRFFNLPNMSPGMARNASLAIVMAGELGIADAKIEDRIKTWRPVPLRGEWKFTPRQQILVDCYNASPASFCDAFAAFAEQASPGMPRLYVLGCMAEMGGHSGKIHRDTADALHLRDGDRAILVGDQADEFRSGLLAAGNRPDQVAIADADDRDGMRAAIDEFNGAILLKGSRKYALEGFLPDLSPGGSEEREGLRAC